LKQTAERLLLDGQLSVSEYCRKYCVQKCHVCDDLTCGDNQSPLKQQLRTRDELLKECLKYLKKLQWSDCQECPVCGGRDPDDSLEFKEYDPKLEGHRPNCKLAATIENIKKAGDHTPGQ
jgi:hypothetical protein